MYKRNNKHSQKSLFDLNPFSLPELQKDIEKTEEYFFYQTIFCNINEDIFAPLYCCDNGRPNASINAMVSALILKEKRNWTYKELFKELKYHLLPRVAIGLFSFSEMPFNQATIFNFQNRLRAYEEKTDINLIKTVFDDLTTEQIRKLKHKTNIARTDSFMIDSNIRNYSRLQLLIEIILRIYRVLSDSDKKRFSARFATYKDLSSVHYIYRLKGSDISHELVKITSLYYWIKLNLPSKYFSCQEYVNFIRVYNEHFTFDEQKKLCIRDKSEMHSNTLQSPDDPDATFRSKRGKQYQGQLGNVTETASPENDIHLVVNVAVATNNTDDSKILNSQLDDICEKLPDLDELHTDGGYGSEDNDKAFEEKGIKQIQTAVKGKQAEVVINLDVLEEAKENKDAVIEVSCPNKQAVKASKTRRRYKACFDKELCKACPLADKCPTKEQKKCRAYHFTKEEISRKKRLGNLAKIPPNRRKIRANVEATVHEFTHRMRGHKLKVRGHFKTNLFVYCTAIAINLGRIYRNNVKIPGKNPAIYLFRFAIKYFGEYWKILRDFLWCMAENLISVKNRNWSF